MANTEHLALLKQGSEIWNKWFLENYMAAPDLNDADLSGWDLSGVLLHKAHLNNTNLSDACLKGASLLGGTIHGTSLKGADLRDASLEYAEVFDVDLEGSDLRGAKMYQAMFVNTNFRSAQLDGASLSLGKVFDSDFTDANLANVDLVGASLINVNLENAVLTDCKVYGVSTWGLALDSVKQQDNLRITPDDEPEITVDNLEVAQFVYLLLHNEKIRGAIDTIGKKVVLILGRFTPDRKVVLDKMRVRLRELGFVPVLFDFEKPSQRDFTETIRILAGMSRFVIADITNPKSSPLELQATVPDYMVPFVPIQQQEERPFAMFADLQIKYGGDTGWMLDVLKYDTVDNLIDAMEAAIVKPALRKADQLLLTKAQEIRERHVSNYQDN